MSEIKEEIKDDKNESQPKVNVEYDFTEKTLYEEVGVTIDDITEDVEKKCNEMLKKNDPIEDPNKIEEYQKYIFIKSVIANKALRNFYDDFEKYSAILFKFIQTLFPMRVMNPKKYSNAFIYIIAVQLLLFIGFTNLFGMQINRYINAKWKFVFSPLILGDIIYLVYYIVKFIQDLKALKKSKSNKKNEDKDENETEEGYTGDDKSFTAIIIENLIILMKFALFVILQLNALNYFESDKEKRTFASILNIFLPVFVYEVVELINNSSHFLICLKAVLKREEPTKASTSIKESGALRYAIGCAKNPSCTLINPPTSGKGKGKETKQAQLKCSGCHIRGLFGIFNSYFGNQIYRITQLALILYLFYIKSESTKTLILILLPTFLAPILYILNMKIQSLNGYVEREDKYIFKIIYCSIYFSIATVAVFSIFTNARIILSKVAPYLVLFVIVVFYAIVILGSTFVMKIESNMKKQKAD